MSRLCRTGIHMSPEQRTMWNAFARDLHTKLDDLERAQAPSDSLAAFSGTCELAGTQLLNALADELGALLPRIDGDWGITARGEFVFVQ